MKEPYLADNHKQEYVLEEYVASYFKINTADAEGFEVMKNLPNFINFLKD